MIGDVVVVVVDDVRTSCCMLFPGIGMACAHVPLGLFAINPCVR